jgi:hypothetical protein
MGEKITFGADKIVIRGPRVDGTYVVTFETGEYERDRVAELFKLDTPVIVEVSKLKE